MTDALKPESSGLDAAKREGKSARKKQLKVLDVVVERPDAKESRAARARVAEQHIIFKDLSSRSALFRSKLMTEFRVLDGDYQSNNAPRIDSAAALNDFGTFSNILLERPQVSHDASERAVRAMRAHPQRTNTQELVKFAPFKRTLKTTKERNKDPRLLRVANRLGSVSVRVMRARARTLNSNTHLALLAH
jgi:hypothetical protein